MYEQVGRDLFVSICDTVHVLSKRMSPNDEPVQISVSVRVGPTTGNWQYDKTIMVTQQRLREDL